MEREMTFALCHRNMRHIRNTICGAGLSANLVATPLLADSPTESGEAAAASIRKK